MLRKLTILILLLIAVPLAFGLLRPDLTLPKEDV
jgi:hypothetical protein